MEISTYELLKALDESNRAKEMALYYAARILADLMGLTPEGRTLMIDTLMELISGVGRN